MERFSKLLSIYEENPSVTGGFLLQRAGSVESLLQIVEQTVDLLMISDVTMPMLRNRNALSPHTKLAMGARVIHIGWPF